MSIIYGQLPVVVYSFQTDADNQQFCGKVFFNVCSEQGRIPGIS